MKCPRCGLINPDFAQRCDCGFDFKTETLKKSYFRKDPPRDMNDMNQRKVKKPEEWSDGTYFILGIVIGAFWAFVWLESLAPTELWAQRLIAFAVPVATGFLAMLIREKIFWL